MCGEPSRGMIDAVPCRVERRSIRQVSYIVAIFEVCVGVALVPFLLPLVSWERRNGEEHGQYYNGLYRDYYKDPLLHP